MIGKERFPSNILSSFFEKEVILVSERNEQVSWLFRIIHETWN